MYFKKRERERERERKRKKERKRERKKGVSFLILASTCKLGKRGRLERR